MGTGERRAAARSASRKPPLTIERSPTGWVLRDPALARLAGVEALPLPFTPEATPGEVLAHLRRLNPHREVMLEAASSPIPSERSEHPSSLFPPCA